MLESGNTLWTKMAATIISETLSGEHIVLPDTSKSVSFSSWLFLLVFDWNYMFRDINVSRCNTLWVWWTWSLLFVRFFGSDWSSVLFLAARGEIVKRSWEAARDFFDQCTIWVGDMDAKKFTKASFEIVAKKSLLLWVDPTIAVVLPISFSFVALYSKLFAAEICCK